VFIKNKSTTCCVIDLDQVLAKLKLDDVLRSVRVHHIKETSDSEQEQKNVNYCSYWSVYKPFQGLLSVLSRFFTGVPCG